MQRGDLRKTAHPGAAIHALVHLHHLATQGYAALQECPNTAAATERERVVTYFILHGIVESLGQVREALTLLRDMQSCFADIEAPFKDDLDTWTRFRDDAAHIIDRTHRVSTSRQNSAVLEENDRGYNAETLRYDWETDKVQTGSSDHMLLGPAITRLEELMFYVKAEIENAINDGMAAPPRDFGGLRG